jgi:hypothetical protein
MSEAELYWKQSQITLAEKLKTGDMDNFLQWSFITEAMFHELHSQKFTDLKNSRFWNRWERALKEDRFGNPRPYYMYKESSGNLLHHAHSLWQFAEFLGDFDTSKIKNVFEFGGGYGSFCRLLRRIGVSGTYVLYDLPEYIRLQSLFLEKVGLPSFDNWFLSEIKDEHLNCDLFVSMWAISESPIALRDHIFSHVKADRYLLIFQRELKEHEKFSGINNGAYFQKIVDDHPDFRWLKAEVPYLNGNFYLFGERK